MIYYMNHNFIKSHYYHLLELFVCPVQSIDAILQDARYAKMLSYPIVGQVKNQYNDLCRYVNRSFYR